MLGQVLVWLQFKPHYEAEENSGNILATFSTGPAIKDTVSNLISEIIGTFVLVLTIFALGLYDFQAGIGTFAVGDFDCRYRSITRWDNRLCLEPCA